MKRRGSASPFDVSNYQTPHPRVGHKNGVVPVPDILLAGFALPVKGLVWFDSTFFTFQRKSRRYDNSLRQQGRYLS